MTAPINRFAARGAQHLADLAGQHPFAWICGQAAGGQLSSPCCCT